MVSGTYILSPTHSAPPPLWGLFELKWVYEVECFVKSVVVGKFHIVFDGLALQITPFCVVHLLFCLQLEYIMMDCSRYEYITLFCDVSTYVTLALHDILSYFVSWLCL